MPERLPGDPTRRRLDDRELTQLQETGRVRTLGGFTLGTLIAGLNQIGLGPEEVEVTGTADDSSFAVWLFVVEPEGEGRA